MPTFTKQEKSLLNRVMDSLAGVVGVPAGWPFKWGDKFSDGTTAAVDLYVETTGNDNNPGTADKPFATIQGALDSLPKVVRHPVTINVGAGNFAGAYVSGFSVENAESPTAGMGLHIKGTLGTVTPTTGSATGTLTSATAAATWVNPTATVTGAGWTVNDFKGKFLEIVSGTGAGQISVIASNTTDILTLCGFWSTTPNSTSVFRIVEPTTIITSGVVAPADFRAAVATAQWTFRFSNNRAESSASLLGSARIIVSRCASTVPRGISVSGTSGGAAQVWLCRFLGTSSMAGASPGCRAEMDACYLYSTTTNLSLVSGQHFIQGSLLVGGQHSIDMNTEGSWARFSNLEGFTQYGVQLTRVSGILDSLHIDGGNVANTRGIGYDTPGTACGHNLSKLRINNCAYGVWVPTAGTHLYIQQTSGTGNTIGVNLTKGATCQIDATTTLTGTTEISVDGVATSLATMRAASPKVVRNSDYGTMVYE